MRPLFSFFFFFFFNDTATTEIYTLSLHDALPISNSKHQPSAGVRFCLLGLYSYFFRSEEHTSELQSRRHLVCRLLLEKKRAHDSRLVMGLVLAELYRPFESAVILHLLGMANPYVAPAHLFLNAPVTTEINTLSLIQALQ